MEQLQSNVQEGGKVAQQAMEPHNAPPAQAAHSEEAAGVPDDEPVDPGSDWMSTMIEDLVHTQVKTALDSVLLPRAREIQQEVSTMQQEANGVANKSKDEQAEVEEELARMAKLVFTFQNHISQFLPNGMIMASNSDPATPE